MNFLIIIICLIAFHTIYNLINYLRFPLIEKNLFYNYSSDSSQKLSAVSHKTQIINYIKNAGVKDKFIPVVQTLGYGKLASSSVSLFDNISNQRQDIAQVALESLYEAKGNYWFRFINSFNPFYWLKIILFIPKHFFSYLGIKDDSIIIKILQLVYWLLGIVATFLLAIFPEEIKSFIFSFLHIT